MRTGQSLPIGIVTILTAGVAGFVFITHKYANFRKKFHSAVMVNAVRY